jgi:hypothetical protein
MSNSLLASQEGEGRVISLAHAFAFSLSFIELNKPYWTE